MDERSYITEIRWMFALDAQQRLQEMIAFHRKIGVDYQQALHAINEHRAESAGADGRRIKQVVGHIMEWERFTLICYSQLLSGVKNRKILWKNGYLDENGQPHLFTSIDEFNAFQAERQSTFPWHKIREDALNLAVRLQTLLSSPLITAHLLEDTEVISPELYDAQRLPIPSGWFLWYVILDHEAVEHANDLYA